WGRSGGVACVAGYRGLPAASGYCATKAAVNSYMDGLRVHLRDRGIAVTTVCPGFVRTPMTDVNQGKVPMPFLMEPEEAARRILDALRRRRKVFDFPWPMM